MRKLLVTVDSLRYDTFCEYMPRTQNFLEWKHDNTYSTGPNTGEAFPAIIGGEYPQKIGLIPGTSVASEFEEHCAGVSTNHLLSPNYNYNEGFDRFSSPAGDGGSIKDRAARHATQGSVMYQLGAKVWNAIEYITPTPFEPSFRSASNVIIEFENILQDYDNWFVWLHFMEPHHPYEPPTAADRLQARQLSRSVIAGMETDDKKQEQVKSYYQQEVQALDKKLQRLWKSVSSDTQVVFCADHGELMGEDGEWGHIGTFKSEVLQVPLGGKNVQQPGKLASLVDVPTLLLDREYNEGSLSRDIAYATNGREWAAIDGEDIAMPGGVLKLVDGSETENRKLKRAQSSFDIKTAALDEADTEDLEQLGYI
jgi:membrane-anchored protein YejM (alkaline phosphatase superfamily)